MKKFLLKTLTYSIILVVLNVLLGRYLATYETIDLKEMGAFFPASRWDDYYATDDNIDLLFLGSSHAYRSYDPEIIENQLPNTTAFNFGSSGQTPLTGYFILNEVLAKHRPKLVVMDVFVMVFAEDPQGTNSRINWSVMQDGPGRQQLFSEGFSWSQKIIIQFFPTYLHRAYLKQKIKTILGKPASGTREEIYEGKGFVTTTDTLSLEDLTVINAGNVASEDLSFIDPKSMIYLEKIKDRCTAEGIPLVLMVSPIPQMTADRLAIFGQSYAHFDSLSQEWNVPYYDYIQDRIPAIKDDQHYYDDHHMNKAGASMYSTEVARVLKPYFK